MKKYVLIGIPGCGKSTLGRRTAEKLNIPFFDTDRMALERLNLANPALIFLPSNTMRCFYEERKILSELAELDSPALIAASPEAALTAASVSYMKEIGPIIHIKRQIEIVRDTLKNDGKPKLVLRDVDSGAEIPMSDKAVELYAKELWQYGELADYEFDNNGSEDDGLDKLVALIRDISGEYPPMI